MKISLHSVSKRFNYDWIFRNVNYTFLPNNKYAIIGANGSGKSTLLRIISGHLSPSEGNVEYQLSGNKVQTDEVFRYISFAAPYLELIEEFSFAELMAFQQKFKPLPDGLQMEECLEISGLWLHRNKILKNFSSGMKQRVKLCLALMSDSPVLLLDEPTTNLDAAGVAWYQEMMERFTHNRLVVISSNIDREYHFCNEILVMENYKKM